MKVSVIGAASYAGGELLRILLNHNAVEIIHLTGNTYAGKKITQVFPQLTGFIDKQVESVAAEEDLLRVIEDSELLFLIMGHGEASLAARKALARGKKVIDVGADFRFADVQVFEQWYKVKHNAPELLDQAVYGLPELYRDKIASARLVGNPGCYPTASLLGLYPLLKAGIVQENSIIIDAKSGVSGAGRTPKQGNIYAEAAQSLSAYGVSTHRHTPEIERIIGDISGKQQVINFTPHLTPMVRGIHSTIYANLTAELTGEDLTSLYKETYANEYFVRVHDHGEWPQSKWAAGSNFCHMAVTVDQRTGRAIICSVIDNLVKGAAGQAVQNLNIMTGLPETTGLLSLPVCP